MASGKAKVFANQDTIQVPKKIDSKADKEIYNFREALPIAVNKIRFLKNKLADNIPKKELEIYESYSAIINDPEVVEKTINLIETENCNASYAYYKVSKEFIDALEQVDDSYLKERVEDLKIPFDQYLSAIYSSSINLAFEGKGEFTFRHLEILASCSFMICQSSINELELPLPLIDGKHFVTFKNKEDLLEKINFYLKNEKLRNEIALNGRKVLEEHYSPKKHGEFLFRKIFT